MINWKDKKNFYVIWEYWLMILKMYITWVSFYCIRNSIDYYIIVKDLRKILSRYKNFTKYIDHGETDNGIIKTFYTSYNIFFISYFLAIFILFLFYLFNMKIKYDVRIHSLTSQASINNTNAEGNRQLRPSPRPKRTHHHHRLAEVVPRRRNAYSAHLLIL